MWKRMVLSLLLASLPWSFCHGENTVPVDMGNPERAEAAAEKWKEKEPPLFEKSATPISNGGLLITPPGYCTGSCPWQV